MALIETIYCLTIGSKYFAFETVAVEAVPAMKNNDIC